MFFFILHAIFADIVVKIYRPITWSFKWNLWQNVAS